MKIKNLFLSTVTLILMARCSNQITVKSDYDKDVNLSLYKTYAWLPAKEIESKTNPLVYNELTDKRIKQAVETQLQNKGIQLATNPDLRVHYHIIIDNKTAVSPSAYGYNYGPYWVRNRADVFQYREGTLIIDLMDSKNKNLIWRGWGVSVLGDNSVSLTEEEINDAVIKILKEFPPSK
jgi:Domain of unknown function (DUF4136)